VPQRKNGSSINHEKGESRFRRLGDRMGTT
jgi:hypothetical protein